MVVLMTVGYVSSRRDLFLMCDMESKTDMAGLKLWCFGQGTALPLCDHNTPLAIRLLMRGLRHLVGTFLLALFFEKALVSLCHWRNLPSVMLSLSRMLLFLHLRRHSASYCYWRCSSSMKISCAREMTCTSCSGFFSFAPVPNGLASHLFDRAATLYTGMCASLAPVSIRNGVTTVAEDIEVVA